MAAVVATTEGRFNPAHMPRTNMMARIAHKEAAKQDISKARLRPNEDSISVPLWLRCAEINPEIKDPKSTPTDPRKKTEPAWLWVIARSFPIVGIRGAKMKRPRKVKKKSRVTKTILDNTALKGSGVGQDLSIYFLPFGWEWGFALS